MTLLWSRSYASVEFSITKRKIVLTVNQWRDVHLLRGHLVMSADDLQKKKKGRPGKRKSLNRFPFLFRASDGHLLPKMTKLEKLNASTS